MVRIKKYLKSSFYIVMLLAGLCLTGANILGLFKDIRPANFFAQDLRFENDVQLSYEQTMAAIKRIPGEEEKAYAKRLSQVIAQGLAHVEWEEFDAKKYNQLIPIWENYFLYFMGLFSGIPEYERYHYSDYKRSLERGIGICGDASMIMSQLLDEEGIENQLITYPGHVVLSARFQDGSELTYDPDFGVPLGDSPGQVHRNPSLVNLPYTSAGYGARDLHMLNRIYSGDYERWDGVQHFITKKYYFEKFAYWLKWPFPILLILISLVLLKKIAARNK